MKLLRFAIALSGLSSLKFEKVLSYLISDVIYYSNDKRMTISEIIRIIKTKYSLNFSTIEIGNALQSSPGQFICVKDFFSLTEKEINRQQKLARTYDFTEIIKSFKKENNITEDEKKIKDLIDKFFYQLFNSSKNELTLFIKNQYEDIEDSYRKFNMREKEIVVLFLGWDNKEKNEMVFSISKAAYDYCILSFKSENQESVFHAKAFLLDTNVIFSLIGINGEDSKSATESFFDKCKTINATICYTNKTLYECKNTIGALVDRVESLTKKQCYFNSNNFRNVFGNTSNFNIFNMYLQWSKGNPNKQGNFNLFRRHMDEKLTSVINKFEYIMIDESIIQNKEAINQKSTSLSNYKNEHGKRFSDNSIEVDVENYLFMESLRNKKSINLNGQKYFFMTFDSAFISWSAKNSGDYTSLIINPYLMYSILLKTINRTEDDYKSFSSFILLGLSNDYLDKNLIEYKEEMVLEINSLDEPDDIKEKILYIANNSLNNEYKENEGLVSTPKEVVKHSKETVYDQILREKDEEKRKAVDEASAGGENTGYTKAINDIAISKAKQKVKFNKFLRIVLFSLFLLGIATIIVFGVIRLVKEGINSLNGWLQILLPLVPVIPMVVPKMKMLINKLFDKILPLDIEHYTKKYFLKISRKINDTKK